MNVPVLTEVDVCAGIGGVSLAAELAGFTPTCFVEIDPFCQRVLAKHWPEVPILGDIRTLTVDSFRAVGVGRIDLMHISPPCQFASIAGKQQGTADPRYLWPDAFRLVAGLRPRVLLVENVDFVVRMVLDDWLTDLESIGYQARAIVLPACAVGAPHLRYRLFVVAHSDGEGRRSGSECNGGAITRIVPSCGRDADGCYPVMAHTISVQRERGGELGELAGPKRVREIQRKERERIRDTAGDSGAPVADSGSTGCQPGGERDIKPFSGQDIQSRRDLDGCSPSLEHPNGAGCQELDIAAIAGRESLSTWGCDARALADSDGSGQRTAERDIHARESNAPGCGALGNVEECGEWAGLCPNRSERLGRGRSDDTDSQDGGSERSECGVGRGADGFSDWLDGRGLIWPALHGAWPAFMGLPQHDWEPPRTVPKQGRNGRKRLKALGNAVVPAQVAPILFVIADWLREHAVTDEEEAV